MKSRMWPGERVSSRRRHAVVLHLLDGKQAGDFAIGAGGQHALVADEEAAVGSREAELILRAAFMASNCSQLKTRPGERNRSRGGAVRRAASAGGSPRHRAAPAPRLAAAGSRPAAPVQRRRIAEPLAFGHARGSSGFSFSPSYQNTFSAGMLPCAAKSNRMTDAFGNMKGLMPSFLMHSTLMSLRLDRWSAMFGAPRMWHAMSPSAPQPKS